MAAKFRRVWRTAAAIWVFAFVGGSATVPSAYYPLADGMAWEYRLAVYQGDAAAPAVDAPNRVTNLPQRELAGRTVTPQQTEAFGQIRVRFLGEDAEGVFELAEQAAPTAAPVFRTPVNYVLKRPLAVGTAWRSQWQSNQFATLSALPTTKTIASLDETVAVPAGRIANCVKVVIGGGGEIPTAPGPVSVRVTGEEWFAPGVGFVKGIFREDVAGFPQNATRIEVTLVSPPSD